MNVDHERRIRALEAQLANLRSAGRPLPFLGVRYTTNAGQTIPTGAYTIVNFEDASFDPFGFVTTGASWTFTASVPGYFRISAAVLFVGSAAWGAGEVAALAVFKNGAQYNALEYLNYGDFAPGVATQAGVAGDDTAQLSAGDTLDVRVLQTTGGDLALFNDGLYNYISITYLGNV